MNQRFRVAEGLASITRYAVFLPKPGVMLTVCAHRVPEGTLPKNPNHLPQRSALCASTDEVCADRLRV